MPHATGTRFLAFVFLMVSFVPPWIQAIVTLPISFGLLYKAWQKEKERERELEALESDGPTNVHQN